MKDKMNTRSFTVPAGRTWSCIPADGGGPFIAQPGETVMLVLANTWEEALRKALEAMTAPEHETKPEVQK